MELKQGYKQTEVGVIPEDWQIFRLHELADLTSSKRIFENDYVQSGIPFYRGKEISQLIEGVEIDDVCYITEVKYSAIKSQFGAPVKGDILITAVGTLANVYVVDTDSPFYFKDGNLIWLRNIKGVIPLFLGIQLRRAKSAILDGAIGSSQKALTIVALKELPVALPSSTEQRAIATALSDVDALLAAQDKLFAKKRDIKQAAMQQLLTGEKRLSGFSYEWKTTSLLELATGKKELFDDGDWIESEHITSDGVRLIQTGNIGVGKYVEKEAKKYIFESSFISLRCKELREGDLLICRLAEPAGRACVLPNIGDSKIVTSVDVTIFRPPDTIVNRVFLANLFSMSQWFRAVSDRSGGTTHKRISRGALGRMKIKLPTLSEQTAIATILSDMDADLTALEQQRDKTRALKQGMMQELLTGRIRLV